jgi:HK97 family phage portal protein
MRLLGFEITKAPPRDARPVGAWYPGGHSGWGYGLFGRILEPFTGAWQRNVAIDCQENIVKFSAVYACVGLISDDISKLRIKLVEVDANGIWKENASAAFSPVLRKPNRYQTRIQFVSQWITSKLLWGNAYIFKQRDARNIVVAMYVLDPSRVTPMVTAEGSVWYRLRGDQLAQVPDGADDGSGTEVMVPASEIIHDRMVTLYHPLVGVSPISACAASATQGIRIQANSERFFGNLSMPAGILEFPGDLEDEEAQRYRDQWQANHSGGRIGGTAVLSGGASFKPITMPAHDAQLIEQLRWTVEDVARCFHVPLHKLGAANPTFNNIATLNQDYYSQTLHALIECLELLLDEGLALPPTLGTELDLEGILRMDPLTMADVNEREIRSGILKPDEARARINLGPVPGGDTPYMQQQNWSLAALDERPPPGTQPALQQPPTPPEPDPDDEDPEDEDAQAAKHVEALTTALLARLGNAAAV